jgi:acyl-coenzyme A synthetase/AMP-(fatty) acid ligase
MSRFADFLEQLQNHATLVCMEGGGPSHTYAELLEQVELWQARLHALNVAPGSVVGLRADYSLAAVAALLALFSRHAIAVLIPRARDITQYLVDARAAAFFELNVDGSYQWHSISPPINHPLIDRLRTAGEGGVILFTSGSTGYPKAALQSVERFLYKFRRPGRRFRTLAFLLFDHVAGLDTLFYTLASGGTLVLTRRRDPRSIIEIIESFRVEVLPTSPSFLRLLCAAKGDDEHDLSTLKIITYGSEPMDHSTLARLNVWFPNVEISQKYGTTETGSPRSVSRGGDSLWLKIKCDGVDTKVVADVLWMRSEGMMLGYLNAPSAVDEEGWYCTGDLVDVDGEWIRFRGRAADTINVGGEKVAPAEVEESILELNFVRGVLVSGEPHPLLGQMVTARVALTPDSTEPQEAVKRIRKHCRERLASYKVPVKVDIVVGALANDRQKAQRKRAADFN